MDEDYTLGDVLGQIWQGKWFMILGGVLGLVGALFFLAVAQPHYRASMIVGPGYSMQATQVTSPSPGDQVSMLRLLMSSVGVENSSDFLKFQNILTGSSVSALLLADKTVLSVLVDDKNFDFKEPESNWTPAKLSGYLKKRVRIDPIGSTPMRTITYYHRSSADAVYFLHALHRVADRMIRRNIRNGAEMRVEYLKDAVSKTQNPEHRRALTNLLLEQERLKMLVSIDQPFAASVVEPPSSSFKPVWPDKKLVLSVFILCGGFLGLAVFGARRAK